MAICQRVDCVVENNGHYTPDENDETDNSSCNTNRSVEETISMLNKECERHRRRLKKAKLGLSYISISRSRSRSRTMSDTSDGSWLSMDSNVSRGCMIVRTLNESLNGGRVVENRKKRRTRNIQLSMKTRRCNKAVQFSSVKVREYPIIPGDNPSVSHGPPLTLDWTASKSFSITIDKFENFRRGTRRCTLQMMMPGKIRSALLLQEGYDLDQVTSATRDAASIRKQRLQTIESLSLAAAEERIESIRRKISKPFRIKENKEEEKMNSFMQKAKCV